MKDIPLKTVVAGIFLLAAVLRLPDFFTSFAYDEIWTLDNFSQLPITTLLTDLSLPNNHPLNSIAVKFMYMLPLETEFIRLPALLCNLASIALAGLIAKRMGGRTAACWSMFFMAVSAPLVIYSMQARGYSMQVFFLLLYVYSLIRLSENLLTLRGRILCGFFVASSALCAVMTLATSSLYLAAATLLLWDRRSWKKPSRPVAAAVLSAAVFSGIFLLMNYSGLQAARKWGVAFNGWTDAVVWLGTVLFKILPWGSIVFAGWAFYRQRQYYLGNVIFFLLIFGSALLTNGGPERVYLPVCAMLAIFSASGVADIDMSLRKKDFRKILVLGGIALSVLNYFYQYEQWKFYNYFSWLNKMKAMPAETLVIYLAGDSYPVLRNSNSEAAHCYRQQLANQARYRTMLLFNNTDGINGANGSFDEKTLPLPMPTAVETIAKTRSLHYALEAVESEFVRDGAFVALLLAGNGREFRKNKEQFEALIPETEKKLMLNCWLSGAKLSDGSYLWGGSWYLSPGLMNSFIGRKLPEQFAGSISFYQIKPLKEPVL